MSIEELNNSLSIKPKKNNYDLCLIKYSKDEVKKVTISIKIINQMQNNMSVFERKRGLILNHLLMKE